MKRAFKLAAVGLAGLLILSLVLAIAPYFLLSGMRESHISANVPDQTQFSVILTRDLNSYFSQKLGSQADAKYQLLREAAFPKFYAWVTVASLPSERKIEEGAIRLAAVDKASFSVTAFVSVDDIKTHPDDLKKIFPAEVIERIKKASLRNKDEQQVARISLFAKSGESLTPRNPAFRSRSM
jgi:hypothetical protein